MGGETLTPEERYARLVEEFSAAPGVTLPGDVASGRGFGADALKVKDKIFAMLARDRLVVKLPRARVDALIAAGTGARFDPGHGRLMREWLAIAPGHEADWLPLAREALAYVGTKQ